MKITTKQMASIAILSAIYVVLSLISFGTNDFKVSVESFAVVVGAVTLGPLPAFLVGAIGQFIYQLTHYGIDPTTVLWLLPYAIEGLFIGVMCRKQFGNISKKRLTVSIVTGEILLTIMITFVNWASAVIQGWGNWVMVAAGIPLRLGVMAVRIVIYIIVLPLLYDRLKKVVR